MLESHIIAYVNSKYRISGTDSHFTLIIDVPAQSEFDSVCMLQASIPKSFYVIAAGRDTFYLIELAITVAITIPSGNYSRRAFALTVIELLNTASPNGLLYSIQVPNSSTGPDNGKYRFTVTNANGSPTAFQPAFRFASTSSPAQQMGFDSNLQVTFANGTLDSQNITNLQATQMIYVLSDCVGNNGTNILQDINTTSPDYSMLIFEVGNSGGVEANYKPLLNKRSNRFTFTLVNANNELLDLNGLNWQCSLLFWNSKKYNPAAVTQSFNSSDQSVGISQ